eukprot:1156361-Pelagomonas_calceolata.AAC.9
MLNQHYQGLQGVIGLQPRALADRLLLYFESLLHFGRVFGSRAKLCEGLGYKGLAYGPRLLLIGYWCNILNQHQKLKPTLTEALKICTTLALGKHSMIDLKIKYSVKAHQERKERKGRAH